MSATRCLRGVARMGRPSLHPPTNAQPCISSQTYPHDLTPNPPRTLTHSASPRNPTPPQGPKPASKPPPIEDHSAPSFNIFAQIQNSSRAVRYTIYTGFALMAAGETTFWANVIYAKWFASGEEKEKADQLLERLDEAIKGYRAVWMRNYGDYYGKGVWGL